MRPSRVDRPRLLTVGDAAVLLQVSQDLVRRALRRGDIPGVRIGRLWRVPVDVIDRLLAGRVASERARGLELTGVALGTWARTSGFHVRACPSSGTPTGPSARPRPVQSVTTVAYASRPHP